VSVALPPQASLVMSTPPATAVREDTLEYDLQLWTDRSIRVLFE
jgi:hypothetical protein